MIDHWVYGYPIFIQTHLGVSVYKAWDDALQDFPGAYPVTALRMIVSQNWHVKLAELRKPTSLKEPQQFHSHEKIDQFLQTLSRFFCSDTAFGPMLFLFMEIRSAVPEKHKSCWL